MASIYQPAPDPATGQVTIQQGAVSRLFKPNGDGSYTAAPGDFGKLSQGGGVYELREKTGILTIFHSDGTLDYIQDANNNRIFCDILERAAYKSNPFEWLGSDAHLQRTGPNPPAHRPGRTHSDIHVRSDGRKTIEHCHVRRHDILRLYA